MSQLRYIIFVGETFENAIPLLFESFIARRKTCYAMGARLIAISDISDALFTLRKEREHLTLQCYSLAAIIFFTSSLRLPISQKNWQYYTLRASVRS